MRFLVLAAGKQTLSFRGRKLCPKGFSTGFPHLSHRKEVFRKIHIWLSIGHFLWVHFDDSLCFPNDFVAILLKDQVLMMMMNSEKYIYKNFL